jgi:tetratricopeptide (TPR) repeat protein
MKSQNMVYDLAVIYNNMSCCYDFLGKYKLSIKYRERCLGLECERRNIIGSILHLGNLYLRIGDDNNSIRRFKEYIEKIKG